MGLIVDHDPDAPLRQGDILQDITVYSTADNGTDDPKPVNVQYLLVISRNCNAFREKTITVAAVLGVSREEFSKIHEKSLDEVRKNLAALRDGDGMPDAFYLGPMPGRETGRSMARLDLIFSIEVPDDSDKRKQWISKHRIATLSNEHRRHLHIRMLTAFGREGFDDFAWWPDSDLKIAIAAGKRSLSEAEKKEAEAVCEHEAARAEIGKEGSESKKIENLDKKRKNASAEVDAQKSALAPYIDEWKRRNGDIDPLR